MNSFSWMIYLAGVSDDIKGLSFILASLCVVALIFCGMIFVENGMGDFLKKCVPRLIIGAISLILVGIVVPSKDVLFAIAASEYGEEALKTPEATKVRAALNAWLDKQIGEQKVEQK